MKPMSKEKSMLEKIFIGVAVVVVVFLALKMRQKKKPNIVPPDYDGRPDYAKPKEPDA